MREFKRIQKKIAWTEADRARHRAIREEFKNKPTIDELLASGDYSGPFPHGLHLDLLEAMAALKKAREQAGLSLADVSNKTGMDRAAISRLENGHQPNPTLETISRYANALGKQIRLVIEEAARS